RRRRWRRRERRFLAAQSSRLRFLPRFQFFGFFPEPVHLFERRLLEALVRGAQLIFDVAKAPGEALDRLCQDVFGFDLEKTRDIDQGEKQIAELLAGALAMAARRGFL